MTKVEFNEIVEELEVITGRKFSDSWKEERYSALKCVSAESFRRAAIENLKTGSPTFTVSIDPEDYDSAE